MGQFYARTDLRQYFNPVLQVDKYPLRDNSQFILSQEPRRLEHRADESEDLDALRILLWFPEGKMSEIPVFAQLVCPTYRRSQEMDIAWPVPAGSSQQANEAEEELRKRKCHGVRGARLYEFLEKPRVQIPVLVDCRCKNTHDSALPIRGLSRSAYF